MKSKQSVYSMSTLLTDARIDKLSNIGGLRPLFVRDTRLPGFGIKVSSQNTKSYFVEARRSRAQGGKSQRHTLGQYPFLTISEARQKALEALKALRYSSEGIRKDSASGADLRALADAFLAAKEATLRTATLKDYRMVLNGSYFAAWMGRPPTSISRRDVLERYTSLCEAHGKGMANKAMRVLSSLLSFGKATVPLLENWPNPILVLSETRSRLPLKPRTGYISLPELPCWLAAVDRFVAEASSDLDLRRRDEIRLLLRLLLTTGLRSNEGRSLKWSNVDLANRTIRIDSDTTKNGREVLLPINGWLADRLASKDRQRSDYVFSHPTNGYIRNLRRPVLNIAAMSGVQFTLHDLRRTFATYLDVNRAPYGVIKRLLNHASTNDITARYIQGRDLNELRRYSDSVQALVQDAETNTCGATNANPGIPTETCRAT